MFMLFYASSFDWGGCWLGGQTAAAMLMNYDVSAPLTVLWSASWVCDRYFAKDVRQINANEPPRLSFLLPQSSTGSYLPPERRWAPLLMTCQLSWSTCPWCIGHPLPGWSMFCLQGKGNLQRVKDPADESIRECLCCVDITWCPTPPPLP